MRIRVHRSGAVDVAAGSKDRSRASTGRAGSLRERSADEGRSSPDGDGPPSLPTASTVIRRRLLTGAFALWAAAMVFRLWSLQVVEHEVYAQQADSRYAVMKVDGPRGTIYDSRGRELAVSVPAHSFYAVPAEIEDAASTAQQLASVLGHGVVRRRSLEADLGDRSKNFVWVERQLDPATASRVDEMELSGIYSQEEPRREYPNGQLAAHVLGFVGVDHSGLAGIEYRYDSVIAGRSLERTVLNRRGWRLRAR